MIVFQLLFFILLLILLLDFVYISFFRNDFVNLFKNVQKSPLKINKFGFVITYMLLTFTVYYFGFVKQFTSKDMFILGVCVYGVYEFTNLSTFKNWKMKMTLLDTLWGGILFYLTHTITTMTLK
jgi:uncharacterized membrane protein